jgi:hypothetical protein
MKDLVVGLSVYLNTQLNTFERSLASLSLQEGVNINLVLYIDGPISSALKNFINIYVERHNPVNQAIKNISVYRSSVNIGIAEVINKQIDIFLDKYPEIQYFARMDSDDECMVNRFERQINYLESNVACMLVGSSAIFRYGKYYNFLQIMPLNNSEIISLARYSDPFIHPSVLFRRALFEKGYRYPTSVKYMEDTLLWQELISAGVEMANIEDPLYIYNIDSSAIKRRKNIQERRDLLAIRKQRCRESNFGYKFYILAYLRYYIFFLPSFIIFLLYIVRGLLNHLIFGKKFFISRKKYD